MASSQVSAASPQLSGADDGAVEINGFKFPRSISESSRPGRKMRASITTRLLGHLQGESQAKGTWVTGIIFLDRDPGFDALRQVVCERLLAIPRFRARLKGKSLLPGKLYFRELALEDIDLEYHMKLALHEGDPVSEAQVISFVETIYNGWAPDLSKPLWQFEYVPRMDDGRAALISKISHVVGDGVSQIEVLQRMLDPEPSGDGAAATPRAKEDLHSKRVNKFRFGPLNRAVRFVRGAAWGSVAILTPPDKYNSLRTKKLGDVSDTRRFAFSENIPLDRIKEVKNKLEGATVNDVLILLLTLTMRAYYDEVQDPAVVKKHRRVRAQFPINTRPRSATPFRDDDGSNQFSYGFMELYLHEKGSLTDLFWKIKRELDGIKMSPAPLIVTANAKALIPILPRKILNGLALSIGGKATGQLSNVQGPSTPVKIGEATVTGLSFLLMAPISYYAGLLSYAGTVACSFCLEDKLGVDPKLLAKHWGPQFERVYAEVMQIDGVMKQPTRALDCL